MNWYIQSQKTKKDKTVRLYHGTNSIALRGIKQSGFIKPFSIEDVVHNIFSKFDIKDTANLMKEFVEGAKLRDLIYRSRFDASSENAVYLTPSKDKAVEYADANGGELIRDILFSIKDKYGKNVKIDSSPVVLSLDVPFSELLPQYAEQIKLMETTGLMPEDVFEQVIINKPVPIKYIKGVEQV